MLSIARIRDGNYYLDLAREDYYLEGGEPPGEWFGHGALALGLTGKVARQPMQALLEGYSPEGVALVQNAGSKRHRAGWDLTFSVPKTVSVLWSQADEETRRIIEECHQAAVRETLAFLEKVAAWTRRGKGGHIRERIGLVIATFEHGTSRAQEPQLHAHCLVFNVGVRQDGTTGTILSTPLFRHKMVGGALYRIALGNQLVRRLGVALKRVSTWFELCIVAKRLVKAFSTRRQEVLTELNARGRKSAKAAAVAALDSRKWKEHRPRGDLLREWREMGQVHGFSTFEVQRLLGQNQPEPFSGDLDEIITAVIDELTTKHSHFAKRFVLRAVAQGLQAENISLEEITDAVDRVLYTSPDIVTLSPLDGEARFTTSAIFEREASLLEAAKAMKESTRHEARESTLRRVLKAHPKLKSEQADAVKYLLTAPGSIKAVKGLPGTGKTAYVLKACREAWEREGHRVIGLAVPGKAARGLEEESGIKSVTFAKLYHHSKKGILDRLNHDREQIGRAMYKLPTYRYDKLKLDPKTIVVVDEAGMVDTPAMSWLVEEVNKHGCTLVLVGDPNQLPSIGVGGPFASLAKIADAVELTDMQRQQDPRDIAALKDLVAGEVEKAIRSYEERGLIHVCPDRRAAVDQLVKTWGRQGGLEQPQNYAVLVTTNSDRELLNNSCQLARILAGRIQPEHGINLGSERICVGEPVVFLEGSKRLDVENGDRGLVVAANKWNNELKVFLEERGKVITVPMAEYQQLTLGYALTTHKVQGATINGNAYVLWGETMQEREMGFTQLSRAKETTQIFVDQAQAGANLSGLINDLKTSIAKDLAHDQLGHGSHPIPRPNLDSFPLAEPAEQLRPPTDWHDLRFPALDQIEFRVPAEQGQTLPKPDIERDVTRRPSHDTERPKAPPTDINPEIPIADSKASRTPAISQEPPSHTMPQLTRIDEPHKVQDVSDRPRVIIPDFHLHRDTQSRPVAAEISEARAPAPPEERPFENSKPTPPKVVIPDFRLRPQAPIDTAPKPTSSAEQHSRETASDIQTELGVLGGEQSLKASLPMPAITKNEPSQPNLSPEPIQQTTEPKIREEKGLTPLQEPPVDPRKYARDEKKSSTREEPDERQRELEVQIDPPQPIETPRHERSR